MLISLCAVASTSVTAADENSTASTNAPSLVGVGLAGGASVCSIGNDLYVFTKSTDNALWWRHWTTASGWSGWTSLGGYITADPAAVSRGTGTIDVFVRGGNGAPYQISTTNGGSSWTGWQKLSGLLADGTAPAVTARDATTLDLFVTGTNRALYHTTWQTSGSASTWEKLDGYLTSSPAATSRSSSTMDVFVRGTAGVLYQKPYDGGWSAWTSLGSI